MKILVVSSKYQPEYSGSGLRAHSLYKRLSKEYRVQYNVVCNSLINKKNETYTYENIEVVKISYPVNLLKLSGLKKKIHNIFSMLYESYYSYIFIKNNRIIEFDILHTFGNSWSVAFFTFYFSIHKKPIVRELVNIMKTPYYPIQFQGYFEKIFRKENTLVVAISKQLEDLCVQFGVKNVWQRPNPVDEDKFFQVDSIEKYYLREVKSHFSKRDVVLLYSASFMKQKNHIFLLDILKLLPNNYKMLLIGPVENEEHKENFEKVRVKLLNDNLEERVLLKSGFFQDIDEYMKMSDIFVFPAWNEALGTPILEAQACGLPVVANFMAGVTDYSIKDAIGGFTVKDFDVQLWIDAIKKSANMDKDILKKNSQYIFEHMSTNKIDAEYMNIFRKIT